jgi:hypothetical protein
MTEYQFPENEVEDVAQDPKIYSFMDILKQHELRYNIQLEDGSYVILRHIPVTEYRRVLAYAGLLYPEYFELLQDHSAILEEIEKSPPTDQKQIMKMVENFREATLLLMQLKPITELMAMGIVVQPHVWSRDSVDAFFSGMISSDRNKVYEAIKQLAEPIPIKYIDITQYFYAKRLNLDLVDANTVKDMTITQAEVFDEIFKQEKIAMERAMKPKLV